MNDKLAAVHLDESSSRCWSLCSARLGPFTFPKQHCCSRICCPVTHPCTYSVYASVTQPCCHGASARIAMHVCTWRRAARLVGSPHAAATARALRASTWQPGLGTLWEDSGCGDERRRKFRRLAAAYVHVRSVSKAAGGLEAPGTRALSSCSTGRISDERGHSSRFVAIRREDKGRFLCMRLAGCCKDPEVGWHAN